VEKYGRAEQATDHNIKRGTRIACRMTKATYTHSECVILLFRRQQWFRERTSVLLLCVHCLSCTFTDSQCYCGHSCVDFGESELSDALFAYIF